MRCSLPRGLKWFRSFTRGERGVSPPDEIGAGDGAISRLTLATRRELEIGQARWEARPTGQTKGGVCGS